MLLLSASLLALSSGDPAEVGPAGAHPQRLLVRVGAPYQRVAAADLCPGLELHELWNLPQIGWRAFEVPAGKREESRTRLADAAGVLEVCHDTPRELALVPNDPLYATQWYLGQIKAPAAWNVEQGDPSAVVALIDTGVDLTHPDLAPSLWTNPGEIPGNGIDDDENGYADDVHGYDFAYLDPNPSDDNGHGTSCAGIVAAAQGNGLGISGVAPGCRLAVIKAALSNGHFYASASVPALVYCADMGFPVLSMSFFSDEVVPAERDAIAYCAEQGALMVVAAGNENSVLPSYPAAYPETLSVGATLNALDARAFFSNWGSWVNVAAPGWNLATTSPFGNYTPGFVGTSGATPQVAGIAALLFSADPTATAARVRAAIEDTCVPLVQAPYGRWSNYGRVDAEAALERILEQTSGSVPARMWFAAPCGGRGSRLSGFAVGTGTKLGWIPMEIAGVGLELPNTVEFWCGPRALTLLSQERHGLRASGPVQGGLAQLRCNGALVQSWTWDDGPGWVYAATDAGTEDTLGSQAAGGWFELHREDLVAFTCTRDASSRITCEFAVRGVHVPDIGRLTLEFRRDYDSMGPTPLETLELYDWSTASYPYGAWVTLSALPAPTSAWQTLELDVPGDPDRYRDGEGTFYLRLTTTGAGASGILRADLLRLRVR